MDCQQCRAPLQDSSVSCQNCGQSVEKPLEQANAFIRLPHGRQTTGVRAQVFEVIVRQALAGAPWQELCAGPMGCNNINPAEIEEEVRRRRGGGNRPPLAGVPRKPYPPAGAGSIALELPLQNDVSPDDSNP